MSEDLRVKVILEPDSSKVDKAIQNINNSGGGSSNNNNGGGSKSPLSANLDQATKLESKFKMLSDAQKQLAAQPGMERNLAKVNQELAGVYSRYKNIAKDSGSYISNLEKEVALRKQANQLTNQANKSEGVYSAHSDRQYAMLQQLSGRLPGGGLINKFLGGARSSALAGEAAGGSGGMMSGGALAGGAMAAGAAAAAAGVALVANKMNEMASRAQELAQSASSATSNLGQLRTQMEKTQIGKDMNAVSGGVTIAGLKQGIEQTGDSILGGIVNSLPFVGKSPQQKQADVNQAISQGLGGDDKEQWRRIKEQGQDTQLDLARQKQSIDISQQRQNRDFNLDQRQFQMDTANQLFDIQKQRQRSEQDYSLAKQLFDENHEGQMAEKQFNLQEKYAKKGYELQRQREQENFQLSQQYKAQDYQISQSRATTQFTMSQKDRSYDFGVSQSRNQTEFNVNRGRQSEDYAENVQKMALSGASGLDYLFASRDFQKQQKRELEDFNRQKTYATQDYTLAQSRDQRNFNLSQNYAAQDYKLGVARDTQQFQISQQRGAQDYGISRQQAQDQRNLQLEDMAYQRKYQGIQLELQHSRTVEDSTIALQRFSQSVNMQTERFGNRFADMKQDQAIQNRDYAITAYRALRGQAYNEQDYAGQVRKSNPLGAYGESLTDPVFKDALARNAAATGQVPLGEQIKASQDQFDWGDAIGRGIAMSIGWGSPSSLSSQPGKLNGLDSPSIVPGVLPPGLSMGGFGGSVGAPNITFSPQTSVTMPTVPGVSQKDLQYWNDKLSNEVNRAIENVYDDFRRIYGG